MASVSLKVRGRDYGGWKTAQVTRGIETVAGSFSLSVSERFTTRGRLGWPIAEGDECQVFLGGALVISGYLDVREPSFDTNSHDVLVEGRDKTADLVDCSALLSPNWEFRNTSLLKFAQKLCAPFGIPVSLQAGLAAKLPPPPPRLVIDPGESAFNALEQACRAFGVLPVSDGKGGLVLTRAGTGRCTTQLVEGKNLKRGSVRYEHSGRFRTYKVLAQHRGTDENWGENVAAISGSASDPGVARRERVLLIRPDANMTAAHAQKRAQWEATVRAARSATVNVTVAGWAQDSGELWNPNTLARVKSAQLGIDGDMLITQVTQALTVKDGQTTQLILRRPDAFLPEPVVSKDGLWKELAPGV